MWASLLDCVLAAALMLTAAYVVYINVRALLEGYDGHLDPRESYLVVIAAGAGVRLAPAPLAIAFMSLVGLAVFVALAFLAWAYLQQFLEVRRRRS